MERIGRVFFRSSHVPTEKTPRSLVSLSYLGTSSASWYRNCDSQCLTSLQKLRLCLVCFFVCLVGWFRCWVGGLVCLFVGWLVGGSVVQTSNILWSWCSFSNIIQVGVCRGISLKNRSPIVKLFFFGWYVKSIMSILLLYHFISVELQTEMVKNPPKNETTTTPIEAK